MKPLKLAVIGHPIAHSKSPFIHNYWLNTYGIDGTYEAIDIAPDDLTSKISNLISEGYNGFNITVPHKENVMSLCNEITPAAKTIGAVNTLVIKDNKILGDNTDYFGFIENIKQNIKMSNTKFNFKDKNIFIIGAGGAARGIIYGLLNEDVKHIFISNRTQSRAQGLQNMLPDKITVVDWEERTSKLNNIDLLINTTSLGMEGASALDMPLDTLPTQAIVTDIVYAPLMTDLLNTAKTKGHPIVTGIGMLLHQARPAFQHWTGTMPNVTPELEGLVLKGHK